jgi:hypothetical protein
MDERYEIRHAVKYPIDVMTPYLDEPVRLEMLDLSPGGAYISCDCLPDPGEWVVCAFTTGRNHQYEFFGQVVRTNLMRRTEEQGKAGFGVEFLNTSAVDRLRIRQQLREHTPPLPVMRKVSKDTKVVKRR